MTASPNLNAPRSAATLDVAALRDAFPVLKQQVHGKPLVYFDNAATAQKPQCVIDAVADFYRTTNANVHRGIHTLSEQASEQYEQARAKIAPFIGAATDREIVFTRGTTESINLVAQSWARLNLQPGDEIVVTRMEHHSNIVPWQMLCEQTGARLKVAPISDTGELLLDAFDALLSERTKLVAAVHVSNALGTINPVEHIVAKAHAVGARVLLDGAQAAPHLPVNVQQLGCDFYALSGHKLFGPTGIGVLWGKSELLEAMAPYQGGGDMIKSVSFEDGTVYNDPPFRFEAGTPNIAGAIGLGAAVDFVNSLGIDAIHAREQHLLEYATPALEAVDGLRLIGTAPHKAAVLSFVLDFASPYDAGKIMDYQGVAVRTGHHCAQPVMDHFGIPATIRASLAPYNTTDEIDKLVAAIEKVREFV